MLDTYLPAALPPAHVVGDVSPAAATKIRAVEEYERSPAKHRTGSDIEELRAEAFAELGHEFQQSLAAEDAALLATLTEDVERLWAHWSRLEQIRGLEHWATHGQRGYSPKPVPVMEVAIGSSGGKTPIMARRICEAFQAVLDRGGR